MSEDRLVKITSVESFAEAEQILQILKQNSITAYRRGGIMDVYTGNSAHGEDIMVAEEDGETARKILEDFQPIKVSSSGKKRIYTRNQKIFCWILLVLIVLICILLPIILM